MSKKKLTKHVWYGSDTVGNTGEDANKAAPPPVAVNDGTENWHLSGLTRGEIYINDYAGDPSLFVLGSDNEVKKVGGGSMDPSSVKPSSLWYPDKQSEYLHLNDDGTITMLETGLGVKGNIKATGDIIAFGGTTSIEQMYAKADQRMYGLVKIDGDTITINDDGQLVSNAAGLDETALGKYLADKNYITSGYLTSNKYITQDYITNGKYISLSSLLDGYAKAPAYTPLSATDSVLSAFGKLDRRFDDYVDRTTDQTIGGVKTFSENLVSNKDVIAYGGSTSIEQVYAIAEPTMYGLVKYDGVSIKRNASGQLYADIGSGGIGGINAAVGSGNAITSLDLSSDGKYITPHKDITFWHAENDGAGSGLDADTLDGRHWSEISGLNVATATKLLYARTINGTPFDGTSNITTNTWGTARLFSIASSDFTGEGATVSVNGFSNYVLPLPSTIKATLIGNASSATKLTTARKLWGQTFDGTGDVNGSLYTVNDIYMGNNRSIYFADSTGVNVNVFALSADNDFILGYQLPAKGYRTFIDGNVIYLRYGAAHTTGIFIGSNGLVGINNTAPGYRLDVGGNIKATSMIVTDEWFQNRAAGKGLQNLANGAQWYADANGWNANKSVISTGDVIAYGGSTIEQVYAIASPTTFGLIKVGKNLTINPLTGALDAGEGGGGFGDIVVNGTGSFLSNVVPSADKKTLTFTKTSRLEFDLESYVHNYTIGVVGQTGGWERGFRWKSLDFGTDYGSVTMFGNNSTPGYISMGFGEYNDPKRIFIGANGLVGVGTGTPGARLHVVGDIIGGDYIYMNRWFQVNENGGGLFSKSQDARWYAQYGRWNSDKEIYAPSALIGTINLQGNNEINCSQDMYFGYRSGNNIITNTGGGALYVRGSGLVIDKQSANSGAHIRLVNISGGLQWGIKSGSYMVSESDFSIGCDSKTNYPYFRITDTGNVHVPNGNIYAGAGLVANNGQVVTSSYGITSSFGSLNNGYCHFNTTAPQFYFNKQVNINGDLVPNMTNNNIGNGAERWNIVYSNILYAGTIGYNSVQTPGGYYRGPVQYGWHNGRGALNVEAPGDRSQTPLIVFGWGQGFNSSGAGRLFSMEILNDAEIMNFQYYSSTMFSFTRYGVFTSKGDQIIDSDMRLKNYLRPLDFDIRSLTRVKSFYYSLKGDSLGNEEIGFSAQQLKRLCGCFVMDKHDDILGKSYAVRYGKMGAIIGVKLTQYVLPWMDRAERWMDEKDREILGLRQENMKLRKRVESLETRLAC